MISIVRQTGKALCLLGVLLLAGCNFNTFRANNDDLPSRYKITEDHVVLHSDVKLKSDDPLITELKVLREQIAQTLELKLTDKQVEVYLFKDEPSYHKFLSQNYPGLPPRRAYFVGTSKKLAVYTVWTDRIREDLPRIHAWRASWFVISCPFVGR